MIDTDPFELKLQLLAYTVVVCFNDTEDSLKKTVVVTIDRKK